MAQFVIDAVAATGTVGAVVVALWLGLSDRRRRDRETRDALASQARLVTLSSTYTLRHRANVLIANNSTGPVTDVIIEDVRGVAEEGPSEWAIVAERNQPVEPAFETYLREVGWAVIPAADSWLAQVTFHVPDGSPAPEIGDVGRHYRVTYSFTDSAGLRWRRVGQGQPLRVLN